MKQLSDGKGATRYTSKRFIAPVIKMLHQRIKNRHETKEKIKSQNKYGDEPNGKCRISNTQ